MPHDLQASLAAYRPYNEQEQRDLPLLLAALKQPDSFTRQNETAHFTASAWVVNPARNKVLMIYHNIYNSWSWHRRPCRWRDRPFGGRIAGGSRGNRTANAPPRQS